MSYEHSFFKYSFFLSPFFKDKIENQINIKSDENCGTRKKTLIFINIEILINIFYLG